MKGIEYDYVPVHLLKDGGEQLKQEYASVNPMKAVPTFVDCDGFSLSQSGAIIEYLDEVYPNPDAPLLPSTIQGRATVRRICNIIGCDIQPIQNLRILKAGGDVKKMDWGKRWITEGFEALEKILETSAGTYSYGDTVTMADLFLVPQVYNSVRFSVELSRFPVIMRVYEALQSLSAFQKADAAAMPDAE